jgi:hypothetical protein
MSAQGVFFDQDDDDEEEEDFGASASLRSYA